jgi:hypothetical protein
MFSADAAQRIEGRLQRDGAPLLIGGSSYSNIFGGGGIEARYCATSFRLANLVDLSQPAQIAARGIRYVGLVFRLAVLGVAEVVLSAGDMIKGIRDGFPWRQELLFVPTRILVSIVLRELITLGVRDDIRRGLPIIHLNFLGYDEQAHRRGPNSEFAHWSLKGIDRAIRRIAAAGNDSKIRRYETWVYADHGQERTVPYEIATGRTIGEAVKMIFGEDVETPPNFVSETIELWRSARGDRRGLLRANPERSRSIIVSAMGPLGHIYLFQPLASAILRQRCQALVHEGEVPLVLARLDGIVWLFERSLNGPLGEIGDKVFGERHRFHREVIKDLERLVQHPDAGEVVIIGWRADGDPLSFVMEWGAHGGPGSKETHGFALLPAEQLDDIQTLRPGTLRERVERYRGTYEAPGNQDELSEPRVVSG